MKLVITFFLVLFFNQTNSAQDTLTTTSGLKYVIQQKSDGVRAEVGKEVAVHYTGKFLDGKVFDSSVERDEPIKFILGAGRVIKGWDEGIALMNVGDKYTLIIPYQLAYGETGRGPIPPKATLIFDVELLSVSEPKLALGDTLLITLFENGIDNAVKKYYYLKENFSNEYNFDESELNTLGYELLKSGMANEAITIFKLNVEAYPESSNVYDSLAEAYSVAGDKDLAIEYYEKALELNPDNANAKQMLEKLNAEE
ncbi:MAG: FKBP-type peptidyl-prolyl cis-trans isomerase [Ignavibacteriales bacterium]|nr:FKBP-type peptidyl-prolyl cis-trans isomerase [Ignavibacteriales bacterium]